MAIKLKIPTARSTGQRGRSRGQGSLLARDPIVRIALLSFLSLSLLVIGFFAYWYVKYDRIIEQRFRGPVFASSAKIFASPQVVKIGSKLTISEVAAELRHAVVVEGIARPNMAGRGSRGNRLYSMNLARWSALGTGHRS